MGERVARALDITVVVAPPLQSAFEGRSQLSLGLPAMADVGDLVETLLRLYPRTRTLLAGDRGAPGGRYMQLVLEAPSLREPFQALGGLAAGHKVFIFALSRPPASSQTGQEG
jgi:hypothetical protein